jgi:hypothetical protein
MTRTAKYKRKGSESSQDISDELKAGFAFTNILSQRKKWICHVEECRQTDSPNEELQTAKITGGTSAEEAKTGQQTAKRLDSRR